MSVFGLDFGTTFSTLTTLSGDGYAVLLRSASPFVSSSVYIKSNRIYIGGNADEMFHTSSGGRLYKDMKRWIGCTTKTLRSLKEKLRPNYEVVFQGDVLMIGEYGAKLPHATLLPLRDLVTVYVRHICSEGEDAFASKCVGVICSVPSSYSSLQRLFMKNCVDKSGYTCMYVLNEPSAAAVSQFKSYGRDVSRIVVYDFGGGTFDVSCVYRRDFRFAVAASTGDERLGGRDVDAAFSSFVNRRFGSDDLSALDVSALKEVLSSSAVETVVPFTHNGKTLGFSKSDLAGVVRPFVERTIPFLRSGINTARWKDSSRVTVVLVGGSSLLPGVYDTVRSLPYVSDVIFPKDLRCSVAIGCSVFAKSFDHRSGLLVVDCLGRAISNVCKNQECGIIFPCGAPLPCHSKTSFSIPDLPNGSTYVTLFEGNKNRCFRNHHVFKSPLQLSAIGGSGSVDQLEVRLETNVDAMGVITVRASSSRVNLTVPVKNVLIKDYALSTLYTYTTGSKLDYTSDFIRFEVSLFSTDWGDVYFGARRSVEEEVATLFLHYVESFGLRLQQVPNDALASVTARLRSRENFPGIFGGGRCKKSDF
jgi:molecular chaperone DnaK (HSP70)